MNGFLPFTRVRDALVRMARARTVQLPLTQRRRRVAAGVLALLVVGLAVWSVLGMRARLQEWAAGTIEVDAALDLTEGPPRLVTFHVPDGTEALADYFAGIGYRLGRVRAGETPVPQVYVRRLPSDMEALTVVPERKSLFVRIVLPLVLRENERLLADRQRLLVLRERREAGEPLTHEERQWLARMAERYKTGPGDLETLLRRVDAVPVSLALAQAATESGWGTSRFAQEGNALYGQWTWSDDHEGLVPSERDTDKRHRVRAFPTLQDSVRAYMLMLNREGAYRDFREARTAQRRNGRTPEQGLDGARLASGVRKYSEARQLYVANLRSVMRANALHQLEGTALATQGLAAFQRQAANGDTVAMAEGT